MNADNVNLFRYTIGAAMVRFEILDKLFEDVKIKADRIVLHVDANAVFCRCYQETAARTLGRGDSDWSVMSCVVAFMNVLAHYRKYCVYKLKCSSTIIVTYDTALTDYQSRLYPQYRNARIPQYDTDHPVYGEMNKTLRKAYKYIQSICSYFEGIYCIDYDVGVDSLTIAAIMRNDERFQDAYHLLFTRNLAATQLINKSTAVLFNQRDKSSLIQEINCFRDGILRKCADSIKNRCAPVLSPSMIPYVCMLGGCHNIFDPSKVVRNVGEAAKLVTALLEKGLITKSISIKSFLETLEKYKGAEDKQKKPKKKTGTKKRRIHYIDINTPTQEPNITESFEFTSEVYNDLLNRYRVFSVPLSSMAVTKNQMIKIYRRCIDLFDQNYLENMNDILAMLGGEAPLLEISALNAESPAKIEYDGSW